MKRESARHLRAAINSSRPMLFEMLETRLLLSTATPVGINLEGVSDYARSFMFVDAMKSARKYGSPNAPWDGSAAVDANGWPTQDAGVCVITIGSPAIAGQDEPNISGTYHLSFTGKANVGGVASPISLANFSYNAATNQTTADVIVASGATQLYLNFTGTSRGVKNIELIRPGYAANTTQVFTNEFLSAVGHFQTLRLMDYSATNNSGAVNWTDRALTSNAEQSSAKGAAWEYAIALANQTGSDLWLNIPAMASDDYITQLATLFHNTYTGGGHLYLEYSNEVWNGQFTQNSYNSSAAAAEEAANPSVLNYDGSNNTYYWSWRRVAEETVHIGQIFESVYGASAFDTVLRPVLASQIANSYMLRDQLAFMDHTYGSPNKYIYAVAEAPYANLGAESTDPNLTVDQVISTLQANIPTLGQGIERYDALAAYYGVGNLAYEGGLDLEGDTGGNFNNAKLPANYDPRIAGVVSQYLTSMYAEGFGQVMYYDLSSPYVTSGTWGLTENIANTGGYKFAAVIAFTNGGLPSVTAGLAMPTSASTPVSVDGNAYLANQYETTGSGSGDITSPSAGTTYDYFLNVPTSGVYDLTVSAASSTTSGQLQLLLDDQSISTISVPNTGGANANLPTVHLAAGNVGTVLSAGLHTLRLAVLAAGFNIHSLTFALEGGLAAPSGVTARGVSASMIQIGWNGQSNATGYIVQLSDDGSTGWVQVGAVGAGVTTFTSGPLSAGSTYYYRVQAQGPGGPSDFSAIVAGTTLCIAPPGLKLSSPTSTTISLNWSNVHGDNGYVIERSADGSTNWTQVGSTGVGVNTFTDMGLAGASNYYYRVRAVNVSGTSLASKVVKGLTAPAAPGNLQATAVSRSQINLTWSDVAGETGFIVQRSRNGTSWSTIAQTAAAVTSYSNTGLSANTLYFYRVIAVGVTGERSDASAVVQVRTRQR